MKSLKYLAILFLLVSIPLFQGCEDFITREPLSNYSNQTLGIDETDLEEQSFSTEEIQSLLQGAYRDFSSEYFQLDYYIIGDARSDNSHAGADNPNMFEIEDWRETATNQVVDRTWGYLYDMVGKSNTVIENIGEVSGITDTERERILGEASFLRAWAYFDIVRLWGNVPVVTQDISGIHAGNLDEVYPILYPEPSTPEEVYEIILQDLEIAIPRVRVSVSNKGIASRGAANGLAARIHAELGNWQDVIYHSGEVMKEGYSLLPDFASLWDNSIENSNEAIFEVNYSGFDVMGNWGASMFIGTDWKKFNTPTHDLVNTYEAEGDDVRLQETILFADVTGSWSDRQWASSHYPFVNKYRDTSGHQNFILMRLADIMLLKAEAHANLGQISESMNLVNEVRARVGLDAKSANSVEEAKEIVLLERRLELAFEGQRYFDLKRSGRAIEIMSQLTGADGTQLNYDVAEFKLKWPIPQTELDRNIRLVQNIGY